jgi:exodeoxyribonuclease-5
MGLINFGKDQLQAIRDASDWIRTPPHKRSPIFIIAGYAGTGKSTILSTILENFRIPRYKVAFATFTGKAAVILRQKGLNAYTIHKLIYNTIVSKKNVPMFRRKSRLPMSIELIAVDEIGMVPKSLLDDLLSFHIPVIGLGDPGQLPPIYGENDYITHHNCLLTKVYRQALDSGVLRFATDIRNGIFNPEINYGSDVRFIDYHKLKDEDLLACDQVICATNANKVHLNVAIRRKLGRQTMYPEDGDKVICTANNFKEIVAYFDDLEIYLVNGLVGYAEFDTYSVSDDILWLNLRIDDMGGVLSFIYAYMTPFRENYEEVNLTVNEADASIKKDFYEFYHNKAIHRFDYGYAITCHKAQGSQYGHVLVYDDCFYNNEKQYLRWLYTAVTRAINKVTVITGIR